MLPTCAICSGKVQRSSLAIECGDCNGVLHAHCANLSQNEIDYMNKNNTTYTCSICSRRRRQSVNDESVIHTINSPTISITNTQANTQDSIKNSIATSINSLTLPQNMSTTKSIINQQKTNSSSAYLNSLEVLPDLLFISEIWIFDWEVDDFCIPGYSFNAACNSLYSAGGVKIKNTKDNYYFSKLNANRGNSKVEWQIMNSILNKDMVLDPNIVLEDESVILSNPSEVSNCFSKHFNSVGKNLCIDSSEILDRNWVSSDIIPETYGRESFFFEPFTASEIHKLIVGLKSSNSKSSDLLSSNVLKEISFLIVDVLCHIFNSSVYTGNFPNDLKTAVVIPLFKKGNTLDPGNYRPISILSPLSKVFEKAMKHRILNFLNKTNFFSNNQFGFRKGKCTEDALLKFCTEICDGLNAGNTCAAIFIDIAKAFDTVQHSLLLHKLFNAGFRGFVLNWFESFISNRKQKVRVGNSYSGVTNVNMGVPQGSVLGPILFLVFINSLLIQRFKGHPTAFADDTSFSYSCKNRFSVFSDMNYDLDLIRRWFYAHGLVISSKTKYMLFSLTGNFRDMGELYYHSPNCKKFPMVPTSIDNLVLILIVN
ncbi:uncharacterized protein LOC129605695 [Condylostylus longicornis]|uniref:uncharacterized protein LOC129605695 n=1 Tax=Condylostylus longicornis TaxID=2530218 RepID=UPI00244DE781|nr:uncharacterized protein LOC129605695 [Condylostylus longicornis]